MLIPAGNRSIDGVFSRGAMLRCKKVLQTRIGPIQNQSQARFS